MVDTSKARIVDWMGSSKDDLRAFPKEIRCEMAYKLYALERGVSPVDDVKTMSGFGSANVREIIAEDASGTYRVVVTVEFDGYIYVLHSFKKKSKTGIKTPKSDMDVIHSRLKAAKQKHAARSF